MLKLAISCGGATYAIQDFDEMTIYAQEAEKIGVDTIWTAEAWIHDAITPLAYLAGKTEKRAAGHGHHAGRRPHACDGRDDGDDDDAADRRAFHHGLRYVRAAGDRGLARHPLRAPGRAHARVHRGGPARGQR